MQNGPAKQIVCRPRLSLAHLTLLDAHPLALIDAAVAGRFDSIGLRIVPPMPSDVIVPVIGNVPLIGDLLARMDDTGVTVLDIEAVWLVPDLQVQALEPAMETGQRLGAQNLLICGNDPDVNRATDTFGAICQLAARYGLTVAIENLPYLHTATVQQAYRMARDAAQPNGRVLIDALHLIRSGGSAADLAALDPSWFAYCQICDARGPRPASSDALRTEARTGRFYPGAGELPLADILDALPAGLPVGVEAPCRDHVALSTEERGRLCGEATHRFMEQYLGERAERAVARR